MKKLAFISMLGLMAGSVFAGQQYVDSTGYALSGYDPVAYWSLEQAPTGEKQPEAVPGKDTITAEFNGVKWAFSTEENREKFLANPTQYAPQFDGHCAYGISQGGKVPANPNLWRIVDDKLYVNIHPPVVSFFEEDIPGHIKSADMNWGELESQAASDRNWKDLDKNDGTYSTDAPL